MTVHPSLTLRMLPGPLGAIEVDGFDPAAHVDDRAASDLLRDALWQHALSTVRNVERLLAVSRRPEVLGVRDL
jgi:hypothetical protein